MILLSQLNLLLQIAVGQLNVEDIFLVLSHIMLQENLRRNLIVVILLHDNGNEEVEDIQFVKSRQELPELSGCEVFTLGHSKRNHLLERKVALVDLVQLVVFAF